MSESETPGFAGPTPASGAGPALTPDAIEAVLSDFRVWLTQLAHAPADPVDLPRDPVDLYTLVANFTALRQEVNLQTRAVRTQQEQSADTLQRFSETFKALEEATEQLNESREREAEATIKPLLKSMIEVADVQILAARELQRLLARLSEVLENAVSDAAVVPTDEKPRLPLMARVFGAGHVLTAQQRFHEWLEARVKLSEAAAEKNAEFVRGRVEAAVSGLLMGLQRIDRTLGQHGLTQIPTEGRPFDPEKMEVIEMVTDSGCPAGEVVEEVKRGYVWNDTVFRFAQVRVAK